MQTKSIFSFFWYHIKPYKWLYVTMLIAPVLSSVYPFAYNYAVKLFIDAMTVDQGITYRAILFPIVLFIAAHLALDIVWRISSIAEWKSEPYVRKSILLNSYDYVQHHSYTFFQNTFTGLLSSKIKGLLDGYDHFWSEMHHGLFPRILKTIVNLGALIFINQTLGLIIFAWAIVFFVTISILSKRLNNLIFLETESRHELIGRISDKLMNIISLLSFSTRKYELKLLDKKISKEFLPRQINAYKCDFRIAMVAVVLYWVMFLFMLFYMIHLRMNNLVSIGDFAFVFSIAMVVSDDIWRSTESLQDFVRAMGDLKSSMSVLKIPHDSKDHKSAKPLIVKNPKIEFRNIKFKYHENNIVFKNLNLTIAAGEKIGLVGHSGAGKSSLLNLLLRYFKQTSGEILIDDQDTHYVTQDSLRENISVIPQDIILFNRTLMENIKYGNLDATDEQVMKASQKAHIHEFIMTLPGKYNTNVGERGIKLSGGQRQRIAIARAILKDAPILILDEATSSLDSHTEKLIQDSLDFFIENKNKTVIAIAHRLSTLKHMDRVIVIDEGRIIQEGTHKDLSRTKGSFYEKLWKLQEES